MIGYCVGCRLPADTDGQLYRHQLYRLDRTGGLQERSYLSPNIASFHCLCGRCASWQGLEKTFVGWFYGYLVVKDRGELLAFCLTLGNVDDCCPVPRFVRRLFGKLFGVRGYISSGAR